MASVLCVILLIVYVVIIKGAYPFNIKSMHQLFFQMYIIFRVKKILIDKP